MSIYLMIALSFLPLVLFFVIFSLAVPGFRIRHGLAAVLCGFLSLVPIVVIQSIVRNLPIFSHSTMLSVLLTALFFNGLIEEALKMSLLLLLLRKKTPFVSFFAMSLLSGLALGCFETVIYLFSGYHDIEVRTATAVVMHSLCAALSGIAVWTWRNPAERPNGGRGPYLQPFVWAVVLHGVYNFFAGFSGGFRWFSLVTIFLTALECRIWFKKVCDGAALDTLGDGARANPS